MLKVLGGIFLILGISIGAGILALPVTTSSSGFFPSVLLLIFCWMLMTFNALLILEANLWLPPKSNIITMARATLGKGAEVIAWISYCLLLYALLSAYIAAGTDLLDAFVQSSWNKLTSLFYSDTTVVDTANDQNQTGRVVPFFHGIDAFLFVTLLGLVVYRGIKAIDYLNRGLIITKIGVFLLLVILVLPHIQQINLDYAAPRYLVSTLMVIITAFGFAIIVPSLRSYFDSDVRKLRIVIIVGSLIPLLCYIVWILAILGALPLEGEYGLRQVLSSGHTTSGLVISLNRLIGNQWITFIFKLFSAVCVITSFLGVSLSLSDFLADGVGLKKQGKQAFLIYLLTFLPSLIIVLFYPTAFIHALRYGGTLCTILLILLPTLMVWNGRYRKNMQGQYKVLGGKPLLLLSFIATLCILFIGISQELNLFSLNK